MMTKAVLLGLTVLLGCQPRTTAVPPPPASAPHDTMGTMPQNAPSYVRADVYFIPWDILFGVGPTPEVVREASRSTKVLTDPAQIAELVKALDLPALHSADANDDFGDYRLVVDLTRSDGAKEAYAATRFVLVRLSDGASHPVDQRFREHFKGDH